MGFTEQFEKIRKDRMGVVSSSVYPGIKELVSEIYPDEAHFIYELLQNAEDAEATEVSFRIMDEMLIFKHNGKQFTDADIDGITNIGASTKKDNYVQAGKFGIGFKSVYAFTETPSIYCDSINFKIEKLLLPTMIEPLQSREDGWTEFHFPFDSPKITSDEAKRKIKQGLLEIESTTLLFLNNIYTINYTFENGDEYQVKKAAKGNLISAGVYFAGVQRANNVWKKFSRAATLNDKIVRVDLAFLMEMTKDKDFRFIAGEDKVCITFLAKNEKSNLKFYINAPFGCTPARDTVNKSDPSNQILVRELAKLTQEAVEELKQENMLTDEFFNILPIVDDEIPDFYMPIVEAVYEVFKEKSCLPTMNGTYVTVENGIMSSRNVIDKVVTIDEVQMLFDNNHLQFVKNRPVNSRAYKFLKNLNIEELTAVNMLLCMTEIEEERFEQWLLGKTNKQLADLYSYLYKGVLDIQTDCEKYEEYEDYNSFYYSKNEYYKEEYEYSLIYERVSKQFQNIKMLKIVKAEDGNFYKASDVRLLTQQIEIPDEYKVVEKDLLEGKDSVGFLKAIGVVEFTEKEMEKYLYKNETKEFINRMNSISSEDDPIEVARTILAFFEKHQEKEINFNSTKYVWTNMYSGNEDKKSCVLATPSECYLDAPFTGGTGFRFAEKIHKKKSLNEIYLNLNEDELSKWIDFLKRKGIYCSIQVKKASYSTGYSSGYHYDYLVDFLQAYINLKNPELNKFIWSFFTSPNGWTYSYRYMRCQVNRNRSIRTEDSAVVKILKSSAWILDVDGKFRVPEKVSEKNIAPGWTVNDENGFLDVIDFGADQRKIDEETRKQEELERLQQENRQEAASLLGFENAEAVMEAQELARIADELKEMGVDLRELYDSKKKERNSEKLSLAQQLEKLKNNDFIANEVVDDGEVFSVPNKERRSQKLKETMDDEKEPAKKNVVAQRSTINQEEKHFVGTEYSSRCQVCSKVIYKKDGSRYFVAMNLLDTGHLEEKYLTGLSTGWNTLCLCPNCAAEFKYGAVSMYDFEEKVRSTEVERGYREFYEFTIQMQGEQRLLHYTPKHLLSLKTSLEYFDENQEAASTLEGEEDKANKELEVDQTQKSVLQADTEIARELTVIKSGDKCPKCGTPNSIKKFFLVYDRKGSKMNVEGRICACGMKYLTNKQWSSCKIDIPVKVLSGYERVQKTSVVSSKSSSKLITKRCPKCGLEERMFADKGMCWDCYKEEMSARFE